MKKVILCSTSDPASVNIRSRLIESFGFKEREEKVLGKHIYRKDDIILATIDSPPIYCDDEVREINAELIVVASKHMSEAGVKSLLAHPVGNWGDSNDYGGKPKTLSPTSAYAIFNAISKLKEITESRGEKGFQIGMEATHHGPFSDKPILFVELGSSVKEWSDSNLGEIVAEACIAACSSRVVDNVEPAIGFGGGHYTPRFTPMILEGKVALGHVAPKHSFPLDEKLVSEAFEKTVEKPRIAYVEWKGIKSEHRSTLIAIIEKLGKEYVRI